MCHILMSNMINPTQEMGDINKYTWLVLKKEKKKKRKRKKVHCLLANGGKASIIASKFRVTTISLLEIQPYFPISTIEPPWAHLFLLP